MRSTNLLARSSRILTRRTLLRSSSTFAPAYTLTSPSTSIALQPTAHPRPFSTSHSTHKGLQPDTSHPEPPTNTISASPSYTGAPAPISDSTYHEIADHYLDTLQLALEDKAEDKDSGLEVEFSAGVLTIVTPHGTYVINKQPPNKQIWLSSPVSGPKRFDWVVAGEGQDVKEGTEVEVGDDGTRGGGKWVYGRDGAVLSDLLREEIGVVFEVEAEGDVEVGTEGSK